VGHPAFRQRLVDLEARALDRIQSLGRVAPRRLTLARAQAVAVGALTTLTLVLRSQVTFDFIYFQF
jgi:hypothetical protein